MAKLLGRVVVHRQRGYYVEHRALDDRVRVIQHHALNDAGARLCRPTMNCLWPKWAITSTMSWAGVVTPTWIGAARGLEGALTSGRGGGSPRPERFVS